MNIKNFTFKSDGLTIGTDEFVELRGFKFTDSGITVDYAGGTPPVPPGPVLDYVGWTEDVYRLYSTYVGRTSGGYGSSSREELMYMEYQSVNVTLRSLTEILPSQFGIQSCSAWNFNYNGVDWRPSVELASGEVIKQYNNLYGDLDLISAVYEYGLANLRLTSGVLSLPNCEFADTGAFNGIGLNMLMSDSTALKNVLGIDVESISTPEDIREVYGQLVTPLDIYLPKLKRVDDIFGYMTVYKNIYLNNCSFIGSECITVGGSLAAAYSILELSSVNIYLLSDSVVSCDGEYPIYVESGFTSSFVNIYVPKELYNDYINDSVWSNYSDCIREYQG